MLVLAANVLLVPSLWAQYQYAGLNAGSTNYAEATLTQNSPTVQCDPCHDLVWARLWDIAQSNKFVEAGIGNASYLRTKSGNVFLWWASGSALGPALSAPSIDKFQRVGEVPYNTSVTVRVEKVPNRESVVITWSYTGQDGTERKIQKTIGVRGWTSPRGFRPIQFEHWGSPGGVSVVDFSINDVYLTDLDLLFGYGAYLSADAPYSVTGDPRNFRVTGGR
jgi:hypothetical protein